MAKSKQQKDPLHPRTLRQAHGNRIGRKQARKGTAGKKYFYSLAKQQAEAKLAQPK